MDRIPPMYEGNKDILFTKVPTLRLHSSFLSETAMLMTGVPYVQRKR